MIRLTRIRALGRFRNATTGQIVNIRKGTRVGYGTDHYYYTFRSARILLNDADLHGSSAVWIRINTSA